MLYFKFTYIKTSQIFITYTIDSVNLIINFHFIQINKHM